MIKHFYDFLKKIVKKKESFYALYFYLTKIRPNNKRIKESLSKKISTEPYDIVVTWFDSNDADWQKSYKEHYGKEKAQDSLFVAENTRANPMGTDTLKYFLRSMESFAHGYRKIFIVTNTPVPSWLNVVSEKIAIVKHEDIFLDHSVLPTFNPMAIESNLHLIPDLLERYVYFNDDVLLLKPVDISTFFFGGEFPVYFLIDNFVDKKNKSSFFSQSSAVAREMLDKIFGREPGLCLAHCPGPMRKSWICEITEQVKEPIQNTIKQRFRSDGALGLTFAFAPYYLHYTGRLIFDSIDFNRFKDYETRDLRFFRHLLFWLTYKLGLNSYWFCYYDSKLQKPSDFLLLRKTLDKLFPFPSKFESKQRMRN